MEKNTVNVLMIAEKPSVAKSIARGLCKTKTNYRKGVCEFCPIHSFESEFKNKKASINVTSVLGHIYSREFPEQYNDRRNTDPFTLFDAPTVQINASGESSKIIEHLRNEASLGIDYLVLWLDNDREGENICFEILKCLEGALPKNMPK